MAKHWSLAAVGAPVVEGEPNQNTIATRHLSLRGDKGHVFGRSGARERVAAASVTRLVERPVVVPFRCGAGRGVRGSFSERRELVWVPQTFLSRQRCRFGLELRVIVVSAVVADLDTKEMP